MYKIALSGKAGTGKNTAANQFIYAVPSIYEKGTATGLAFADPIKQMVKTMFPQVKSEHLYGDSKFRNEIITGATDSDGNPLTIRRALIDIGTKLGRGYNDAVWLENMGYRINEAIESKYEMILITDVRFRNEFDWLRTQGFYILRVIRNTNTHVNHISETGQEEILDSEFDYLLDNNGTINDLLFTIRNDIIPRISYV